jgi:hypothetical protein
MTPRRRIAFRRIAEEALARAHSIVPHWLKNGRREAHEWIALNPLRNDQRLGSFKVNLRSGAWSDFSTGDSGGDLVSLAAYLFTNNKQSEAAIKVAQMLGIDPYD